MKVELSREELLLLKHALEFNTTGTRQSNYAQRVARLTARLEREINPHVKAVSA